MSCGAKYNFEICQGTTVNFGLQYTDISGSPVDLRNYGARLQIRQNETGSSNLYLTLTSSLQADGTGLNFSGSNGITSPQSGSIGIYISAATSSLLNFDQVAFYDLFIFSGSFSDILLEGKVKLDKRVTL
jgi:hypothetical protein